MKIPPSTHLILAIVLVWSQSEAISCNPLVFPDPTTTPMLAMPPMPMPLPAPMLMTSQFNPYASMHAPQYILAPQYGQMPFDSHRRSLPGLFKPSEKHSNKKPSDSNDADEKKALGELPVSFVDPEGPSTITERLSDSFSAIGEGVRNHFRSITENFSDTMDDIKDAWRSSDNSRKG